MLTISVLCASYSSAFSFFFFFLMLRRPPRSTLFPYTTSSDLREERERPGSQLERVMVHEPLRVNGAASVAALGGVMLTIIAAGRAAAQGRPWVPGRQEAIIALLALIAYGAPSRGHP